VGYRQGVSEKEAQEPANSRELILDAAESLLVERGYAGTSIAAVCAASGLPTGSIYWHFGNKAGVAAAVMQRGARAFFARLPRASELKGNPDERLRSFFEAAAEAIAAHPSFFRLEVVLNMERHDDEMREILRGVTAYTKQEIVNVVEPAARDSGVAEPEMLADELAELTIALTRGSLLSFGGSGDKVTLTMRRLHHLIVLSIADAAARAPLSSKGSSGP
jgi:AcrR family transcriptional regulator